MHSYKTSAAVLAATFFTLSVRSQAIYYIDPNSVPLSQRQGWCTAQTTSCPLLCLQLSGASSTTAANDCDPTTLNFDCICGNGLSPNASEFSQTLPYFICTQYGNQCVAGCGGNIDCQSNCRSQHPCGAQNPTRINATTTTATSATATNLPAGASSASGGVVYNGLGGVAAATTTPASGSTTKKSGSEAALDMGRSYGLAIVFAGLFAGFALVM